MIVITAPTSSIGSKLVAQLLADPSAGALRLIARDPAKLPAEVRDDPRVELVAGSHGDPAVVDSAFDGADAVFWLAPPDFGATDIDDTYTGFAQPAIAAIRAHRVGHVVGVSALGRGTGLESDAGLVTASLAMDDAFAASGAAYRALANPSFIDNLLRSARGIAATGEITDVLRPDLKAPMAATVDIAAAAAALLTTRDWTGFAERAVLGPEDLSQSDVARILGEVLGRPVTYRQITVDEMRAAFTGHGASEAVAAGMVDMMAAKDRGLDNGVQRTAEWTTPTTLRAWAEAELLPLFGD